jgi:hypothetical protein
MDRVVDEAESPGLHRFLSMARLLMNRHPRMSAERYGIALGDLGRFRLGWNESPRAGNPTKYIFISPQRGVTTLVRPAVPVGQIHVLLDDELPVLEGTAAWRQLVRLGAIVRAEGSGGVEGDWVGEVVRRIAFAGAGPVGLDPAADVAIQGYLSQVQARLRRPPFGLDVFTDPVTSVLAEYMDFRLTGPHAANILAVLLFHFATRIRSPVGEGPVGCVLDQIDHLIDLIAAASDRRWECDLGSCHRLSYLAMLYAETTVVMCRGLRRNVPPDHPAVGRLAARARYADEFGASNLDPLLVQPQDMFPIGVEETRHAVEVGVDPAFRRYGAPAATWDAVASYSRGAVERFDWSDELAGTVICASLRERLTMFLVAYTMGSPVG